MEASRFFRESPEDLLLPIYVEAVSGLLSTSDSPPTVPSGAIEELSDVTRLCSVTSALQVIQFGRVRSGSGV